MTTKAAFTVALTLSLGLLTPGIAQTTGGSTAPAGGATVGAGSNQAPVQAGSNTSGIGAGSNTSGIGAGSNASAVRAGSNSATVGAGSLSTLPATGGTATGVAPAGTNVGTNTGVAPTTTTARPRGPLNANRSRTGEDTERVPARSRSLRGGSGFQGASFPGTPEDAPVPRTLPGTDSTGDDNPRTQRAIEASGSSGGTGTSPRN